MQVQEMQHFMLQVIDVNLTFQTVLEFGSQILYIIATKTAIAPESYIRHQTPDQPSMLTYNKIICHNNVPCRLGYTISL